MTPPSGAGLSVDALVDGVRAARPRHIARAITLVESTLPAHRAAARELLERVLPYSGAAHRVGVTGVPGAGKSTFIDALGVRLTQAGRRVAVLAVDPSSTRYGGSILGDKTRMARLASTPNTFIRPSPSAGTLGGVARATREAIVIVEAAGYDVVLVETVGVGQSETAVAGMVDTFLLLMVARTGDSLQGIKKGILELADVVAVNKADGDHMIEARAAARELSVAMRLFNARDPDWRVPVLTCSALNGDGLDEVWRQVVQHRENLSSRGRLADLRGAQEVEWMWAMVQEGLLARVTDTPRIAQLAAQREADLRAKKLTAAMAADEILAAVAR